jgi:hypothetical protein
MAIDIQTEKLIGLNEAARLIPGRDGGTVHVITVGLWTRRGKRGVILESVLAGPRRCTSVEAVQRFLEAVTRKAANGTAQPHDVAVPGRTRSQRSRDVCKAAAELEAAGA